jgi:hypothetical protein
LGLFGSSLQPAAMGFASQRRTLRAETASRVIAGRRFLGVTLRLLVGQKVLAQQSR